MANYRGKIKWKSILCGILVVVTLIGACAVIAAIAKKDTKEIKASAFSRGDLDEKGVYVDSDQTIYTKDTFECIGLRIEPDFEFSGKYDVYYYDYDGRFIHSVKGLNGIYDEDYPLAQYARVVIRPDVPEDVKDKDFKIRFYEVIRYAKNLKITVDKEQEYLYGDCVNLYDDSKATYNATIKNWSGAKFELLTEDDINDETPSEVVASIRDFKVSSKIDISNSEYEYYDIFIKRVDEKKASAVTVVCAGNGDILKNVSINLADFDAGEWCKMTIDVTDITDADGLYVRMPADCECYVFGYND